MPRETGHSHRQMSLASGVATRRGSVVFRREASQFRHIVAIFDKPRSPYNPESIASDAPAMIIGKKAAAILVA